MSNEDQQQNVAASGNAVFGGLLEFERPLQRVQREIEDLEKTQRETGGDQSIELTKLRNQLKATLKRLYSSLTPWETVLVARHPKRPLGTDYLRMVFRDLCELHGDRRFGDDKAILSGFGRIGSHKVVYIAHNKGRDVKERLACHFGCAHPEGYRKALRLMKLAEKFGLPVVCLIDTQGAYPGIGAEERGIGYAIAENLREMARLRTPIICSVISEGGSGGALGLGVGDRIAMFQNAFYSVISPEGCAAILWKTADWRKQAAEALRLTSSELLRYELIDEVIPEPVGGAHRDPEEAAANLERFLLRTLDDLRSVPLEVLVRKRYERVRQWGSFYEDPDEVRLPVRKGGERARKSTTRASRLAPLTPQPQKVSA